jgi:hypothetical protein
MKFTILSHAGIAIEHGGVLRRPFDVSALYPAPERTDGA